MSTTHNHDNPAASTLAETDQYAQINGTTARGAYATGAQLRRFAHGGLVNVTAATLAVAAATHAGRVVTLNRAAGITSTLPAATGTGDKYTFIVGTTITSNNYVFSPTGNDTMFGFALMDDGDGEPANGWTCGGGNNTVTLGGTSNATGGVKGDRIEFIDIAADEWQVSIWGTQGGTEATPFSTV